MSFGGTTLTPEMQMWLRARRERTARVDGEFQVEAVDVGTRVGVAVVA